MLKALNNTYKTLFSKMASAEQRKALGMLFLHYATTPGQQSAEQLMGTPTGVASIESQYEITDERVCKSFLCGGCPHDLLSTKSAIGPCQFTHSEKLKTQYEAASEEQKREWGFEFNYLSHIQNYIRQCDATIAQASKRLEKTAEEARASAALLEAIKELNEENDLGVEELKVLASLGQVNLAFKDYFYLRQNRALKAEKERELRNINDTSGSSGHQKLQLCDVCGAYLSRLDNDRRLADHFWGKMHMGYAQMRETAKRLGKELEGRTPPPRMRAPGGDGANGDYGRGGGYRGRGGGRGRGRGRGGRDYRGSW